MAVGEELAGQLEDLARQLAPSIAGAPEIRVHTEPLPAGIRPVHQWPDGGYVDRDGHRWMTIRFIHAQMEHPLCVIIRCTDQ
jgi:hypothetical protein